MEISVSLDVATLHGKLGPYIDEINTIPDVSFHCDVMRENFVQRHSTHLGEYEQVMKTTRHPTDVHFMAAEDVHLIREVLYMSKRLPKPRSITFHVEAIVTMVASQHLAVIKANGIRAGIAIDLGTPVESINPYVIKNCDVVTIMSVKAGASGQVFNPIAIEKARDVRRINPHVRIIMDGGINPSNIMAVRAAGVDVAVMGSFIYNMPSPAQRAQAVAKLLDMIRKR